MAERDDGGPAFPITEENAWGKVRVKGGMTLRDHFAAAALQGMVAGIATSESAADVVAEIAKQEGLTPTQQTARICFDYADAMIEARKK